MVFGKRVKNMVRKLERYVPPGFDLKYELNQVLFIFVAIILMCLWIFWQFKKAYNNLFCIENGVMALLPNAHMVHFQELTHELGGLASSIPFFSFLMIRDHYRYFKSETQSIYLMLRLPKRTEYHKRCWALPIAVLLLSYVFLTIAKAIFFAYYKNMVPLSAWPPGQSMNLWSVIL